MLSTLYETLLTFISFQFIRSFSCQLILYLTGLSA